MAIHFAIYCLHLYLHFILLINCIYILAKNNNKFLSDKKQLRAKRENTDTFNLHTNDNFVNVLNKQHLTP